MVGSVVADVNVNEKLTSQRGVSLARLFGVFLSKSQS